MAVTCRLFLCVLASCILTGASRNTSGFLAPRAENVAKNSTLDVLELGRSKGGDPCLDDCLTSFHRCNRDDPTAFARCASEMQACRGDCAEEAAKVTKNTTSPISQNVSVKSKANFAKNSTSDVPNMGRSKGGDPCLDDCLTSFHRCNRDDPTAFARCASEMQACRGDCAEEAAKVTKNTTSPISQNVSVKSKANFAKNSTSDVPSREFLP